MTINAAEIQKSILATDLTGDRQSGLLRAFGVILAINSVDYLVDRELEYLHVFPKAERMVENSLIDAAQWCCNATFGGIMKSDEWKNQIEPSIHTPKDRIEALQVFTNCLGWGRMESFDLNESKKELTMIVKNSYYIDSYLKNHGKSTKPRCYMWTGVAAGFMDLVFGAKIHDFEAKEIKCGCMGDDYCEFLAKPVPRVLDLL